MVSSLNYIDNYTLPAPVLHIHGVVWLGSASGWGEPLPLVRLARANAFGLRAFARGRWKMAMAHNVSGVYDETGHTQN